MSSQNEETSEKTESFKQKVRMVEHELKTIKAIAGMGPIDQNKTHILLKKLQNWFQYRSQKFAYNEEDFDRFWHGLFYAMWNSDKPLPQEECAELISSLIHSLPLDQALLFFKSGLTILLRGWDELDHIRTNKFQMLVRRLLRHCLMVLKEHDWRKKIVEDFTDILFGTVLNPDKKTALGLTMHFADVYLEEIAKVSEGKIGPKRFTLFLIPFIKFLAVTDDKRFIQHFRKEVFEYLMKQGRLGLEYQEKYEAWRSLGFPGTIDSMQKVQQPDEDDSDLEDPDLHHELINDQTPAMDPRAGRCDVILPQINFSAKCIEAALLKHRQDRKSTTKSRKALQGLANQFAQLAQRKYPLGTKSLNLKEGGHDLSTRRAVNRLVKFDKKIVGGKTAAKKRKSKSRNRDIIDEGSNQESQEVNDENDDFEDTQSNVELRPSKKRKIRPKSGLDQIFHETSLDVEDRSSITNQKPSRINRRIRSRSVVTDGSVDEMTSPFDGKKVESIIRRNSGTWIITACD